MSEEIINGIDVSEEIRYCNNCSYLGLDFKTGKFYCSLSHRPDELPEILSCDEFSTNCYIKRLGQEIEAYQLSENEAEEIIAELKHKNKRLQEENKELKEKCKKYSEINEQEIRHYVILTNENKKLTKVCQEYKDRYCELYENADQLTNKTYKYKQALEEIRNYCDEQNLKADYTACYITNRIDEVLNDK